MLFAIIQHSHFPAISDCSMFFLWKTKIPETSLLSLCDSLLAFQLEKSWAKLCIVWVAHLGGSSHLLCHSAIYLDGILADSICSSSDFPFHFSLHHDHALVFSSQSSCANPSVVWHRKSHVAHVIPICEGNFSPAAGTSRAWSSRVWATQPHFCSGCWSCI